MFSWSTSKKFVAENGNGRSSGRGEGAGVLLAESVLIASGTRQSNLDRWVADPRGTFCSLVSTNMVKLRLPLRFLWAAGGVKGDVVKDDGVKGDGDERDDAEGDGAGVNGIECDGIGVNGEEMMEAEGVEGRLLTLAERVADVLKAKKMLLRELIAPKKVVVQVRALKNSSTNVNSMALDISAAAVFTQTWNTVTAKTIKQSAKGEETRPDEEWSEDGIEQVAVGGRAL
jgi:hypothetical protein